MESASKGKTRFKSLLVLLVDHPGKPEVPQFDLVFFDEDILRLDVAVQNVLGLHVRTG